MSFSYMFWIIIIVEGLMVAGYSLSFPFLSLYLTQTKNFNMSFIGLYFSFVMFISSLSSTFGGYLSDHMGRKKIMFYSLILRGFFIFLISFSMYLDLNTYYILIFNFLSSVGGLGFHSVALAYISDTVEEKNRINAYSILRIATNAGWAIGPSIGGFLSSISYPLAFFSSSITFFIAGFFIMFFLKESIVFL